ncbi:MAG: hypothetical protein Q4A17_10435 [Thermoguttaceae bacterium]|nr:hypothetical protein [Thermoguttaceae bacterium]
MMKISRLRKYVSVLILTFGFCPALFADTTFTWQRGENTVTSESTNLQGSSYGSSFQNNDIITIYTDVTASSGQFNANGIGADGQITIQSATPGTQVTITCETGQRFCDYAHGTYILSDLHFLNFGKSNDGGAVFYRNDLSPTTFVLSNVTAENGIANNASAFRAATGMTVSGTATFLNNTVTLDGAAVLTTAGGNMTFQGAGSNITFTGSKYKDGSGNLSVGYDVSATNIAFNDAGTYSLGGGIKANGAVTINGASVTLGEDSKSAISGKTTVQAGTLTLNSTNFTTSGVEVSAGATLATKGLTVPLTNNGTTTLTTASATITNLAGTDTAATISWDPAITDAKSLTLNNTADTSYAGTIVGDASITKTGANELLFPSGVTNAGVDFTISQGTIALGATNAATIYTIAGDVTLDGGAFVIRSANAGTVVKVADHVYVTENGGTIGITGSRAYVNGLLAAPDADTSNTTVYFNGGRVFINGTSTYKGFVEVNAGWNHFSNESLASTKGLVLNGGTVQFYGENPGGGTATNSLSVPIYMKGTSAIQCGWSATFNLNGSLTDLDGADLTNKRLNINKDSGYVVFNGEVNTKAILYLYDNAKIGGANDATFGGLGGAANVGLTLAAATTKNLTLNVDASTSPSYAGQLASAFNLVKTGAGTQTFATTGIGSSATPLNSLTINEGAVKMTDGAPIYTNALTLNADGTLEFGTGTYNIQTPSITGNGGQMVLAFNSATDYTVLDFTGSTFSTLDDGILGLDQSTYTLEQFKEYEIAKNVPAMAEDFNYQALLGGDSYGFSLNRVGNSLILQMDNNAVPEPAAWLILLLGIPMLLRRR